MDVSTFFKILVKMTQFLNFPLKLVVFEICEIRSKLEAPEGKWCDRPPAGGEEANGPCTNDVTRADGHQPSRRIPRKSGGTRLKGQPP